MNPQVFRTVVLIAATAFSVYGQTRPGPYVVPKTPWGDPDLQGIWPGNMGVPMQRPVEFGERNTLTDAEFARREAQARAQAQADAQEFETPGAAVGLGPPSHWTERGKPTRQASLIVFPENGE